MNRNQLIDKLSDAIAQARVAAQAQPSYPFLPEIIESLEAMENRIDLDKASRSRIAGALERLVTENFAFSESALGELLLEVANLFTLMESGSS